MKKSTTSLPSAEEASLLPRLQRRRYSTDLTDAEWARIEHLIPAPLPGGRPAKYERREILNAIFYLLRSGCSWRDLPHDFPPHKSVNGYYNRWRDEGLFERINEVLRKEVRQQLGRDQEPSAASIDTQSVKTTEKGGLLDTVDTMQASA
jgi:putative transposase